MYFTIRHINKYIGQMYKILEEKETKNFCIKKRVATKEDCKFERERIKIYLNTRRYFDLRPGTYTYLCAEDDYIMSDTPTEIFTNVDFIYNSKGDILIAGLGLGIMPLILSKLSKVKSVIIVEKEKEVIDLVWSQLNLNSNISVICEDIFKYQPKRKYDTIYFDIWSDITIEAEEEMRLLENKFKPYLNPEGWIGCWEQDVKGI